MLCCNNADNDFIKNNITPMFRTYLKIYCKQGTKWGFYIVLIKQQRLRPILLLRLVYYKYSISFLNQRMLLVQHTDMEIHKKKLWYSLKWKD